MAFHVPDMTGWSELERARFYDANKDHVDDIFSGDPVTVMCDPNTAVTERDGILMTCREAQGYDAKKRWLAEHRDSSVTMVAVPHAVPVRDLVDA